MTPAQAPDGPRRVAAAYTGGFLFDKRIRRILSLAGWDLRAALSPAGVDAVAVWGRRPVSWRGRAVAARWSKPLLNVEDAFLRSVRPGTGGEPPLGLLLDTRGLHYDAAQPSDLEVLLATAELGRPELTARARDGIAFLRREGISKYSNWRPDVAPPRPGYVLVIDQTRGDAAIGHAGADTARFAQMLAAARADNPGARIVLRTHPVTAEGSRKGHFGPQDLDPQTSICADPVNPWALLEGAEAVYCVSSQMGFEAVLAGHKPHVFAQPFYAGWGLTHDRHPLARRTRTLTAEALFAGAMLEYPIWYDPYRDRLTDFETTARTISAQARAARENATRFVCTGMKPWKHKPVAAFLAGAQGKPLFENAPEKALDLARRTDRALLIWAGKETPELRAAAQAAGVAHWRMEDGFLRSVGLGAQLLPAASLVLDDLGIYFDPTGPSRLEHLIEHQGALPADADARAGALADAIVAARLTKYNVGSAEAIPASPGQRRILVPGQVEDDASIRTGTTDVSTNLELLRRARAAFPNDFVIYKPHPDVEVGLRAGAIDAADLAALADLVARDISAAEAMDAADVVWTMTSLMGFEALLRGREVHCLGMPFYAGWGLTDDHGQTCARRTARPTLAGLIHAALIDYPRYFDAQTGLACPVEVTLERLAARAPSVSRHAAVRHKYIASAQYRLRRFQRLWRR